MYEDVYGAAWLLGVFDGRCWVLVSVAQLQDRAQKVVVGPSGQSGVAFMANGGLSACAWCGNGDVHRGGLVCGVAAGGWNEWRKW